MTCKMCLERGKTWKGSDPKCAFEGEYFSHDNWNCATVNAIRDICYEGQNPMPHGVDYRFCEDQKYATILIHGIDDDVEHGWGALWVTWYKSRGRTDGMFMLPFWQDDPEFPSAVRPPTEIECLAIIRRYAKLGER